MANKKEVGGRFETINGERYYAISNVDCMPPFLISLVSDSDHWMFIASNGGLTAGRVSPETALFPYITVDRIYESPMHTGSRTLLRVEKGEREFLWEPFNLELMSPYLTTRNLYKSALGNRLLFEEINHDLELVFRYGWSSSREYGFVRDCELSNRGADNCRVHILDGVQNLLPAATPRHTQANASYLVDAYKFSELDNDTGLGLFTLYSGITDRAEPCESLRATTVFCLGLADCRILLSNRQLAEFRRGESVETETLLRGHRGAYLVNAVVDLDTGASRQWQLVADIEKSQAQTVSLQHELKDHTRLAESISRSIEIGSDRLARILAAADGFQLTGEESVSEHHCANVLFNTMRGGIFDDQYLVHSHHFKQHVRRFNRSVYDRHIDFLSTLPDTLQSYELLSSAAGQGDPQLERLSHEYLPITFGRRHGDPSRPWNEFAIKLLDEEGKRVLAFQGNWRDIFQNWEALLLSYPEYIEQVIAKFVNASTADGYNPYRISESGIDWEAEDPEDPWSYIGYWGDHQIIYLLKLLEISLRFHPDALRRLLPRPLFSYANVPYRIKSFQELLGDPKDTVVFDRDLETLIAGRVARLGADGKLLLDATGEVLQVNLLEKLLVPLLTKLGNLVVEGGIWLNTQRPEWNDANNALVGQGLSMVTLYYMRRYISFLRELLSSESNPAQLSAEVSLWLRRTGHVLARISGALRAGPASRADRLEYLQELGEAASDYRHSLYRKGCLSGPVTQDLPEIRAVLDSALEVIDHSIRANLRTDGLYQAYNLLVVQEGGLEVDHLYPMLEGQVAALSSGAISPAEAVGILETLFAGELYRVDQQTFLLYPDRDLPGFLHKAIVPADQVTALPVLERMLERRDPRIIDRDMDGVYRFNPSLVNARALSRLISELESEYGEELAASGPALLSLYEQVFEHRSFTGRAGGMFAFEGLGSIYWHMVSKLLLAVQELFFIARERGDDSSVEQKLGELYYRVRSGIGFNKTPAEYGAFPTDPYSHTPAHMGAQQPGMTGQVKEEIITRFGELGLRIREGELHFDTGLLRPQEFAAEHSRFRFLDVTNKWVEQSLPARSLAFTWCQTPVMYRLEDSADPRLSVHRSNGDSLQLPELTLPPDLTHEIMIRSGHIRQLDLIVTKDQLFAP
jgi:hypothetical protein